MAPTRSVQMAESQQSFLLDYMTEHPLFASGKFIEFNGREKNNQHWDNLALSLNAQGGGCSKSGTKWREAWLSWKRHTRTKAMKIRAHMRGTGGGQASSIKLTLLEEKLVQFMSCDMVYGVGDVQVFGVDNREIQPETMSARVPETPKNDNNLIFFDAEDAGVEIEYLAHPLERETDDSLTTPATNTADNSMANTYRIAETAAATSGQCKAVNSLKRKLLPSTTPSGGAKSKRSAPSPTYSDHAQQFVSLEVLRRTVAENQAATLASFLPILERLEKAVTTSAQAATNSAQSAETSAQAAVATTRALEAIAKAVTEIAKTVNKSN